MLRKLIICLLVVMSSIVAHAQAQLRLLEDFNYPNGAIDGLGENEVNGWVQSWKGEGLRVEGQSLVGQGHAVRTFISRVEFELESTRYFMVEIGRSGAGRSTDTDHVSMSLYNNDRSVDNRPLKVGISSGDVVYASHGKDEAAMLKQPVDDSGCVLIVRLRTHIDARDEANVWVVPIGQRLPSTPTAKPDLTFFFDYLGTSNELEISTGNAPGLSARIDRIRMGENWHDVIRDNPEDFRFTHHVRMLPYITAEPNAVHMITHGWGAASILPWDNDKPQLIQCLASSYSTWMPEPNRIYTIVSDADKAAAAPALCRRRGCRARVRCR